MEKTDKTSKKDKKKERRAQRLKEQGTPSETTSQPEKETVSSVLPTAENDTRKVRHSPPKPKSVSTSASEDNLIKAPTKAGGQQVVQTKVIVQQAKEATNNAVLQQKTSTQSEKRGPDNEGQKKVDEGKQTATYELTVDTLSKAELRAQRRAKQETQRQAKASVKEQSQTTQVMKKKPEPTTVVSSTRQNTSTIQKSISASSNKCKGQLFNHLELSSLDIIATFKTDIHPAFLQLGSEYRSKVIIGSNSRCLALMAALKSLLCDFETPPKQEFGRSLEASIQTYLAYLHQCRPLAVSMINAMRHFKSHLRQIDTNLPDNKKRAVLLDCIEVYLQDEIAKAGEAISIQVRGKVFDNDIILIYGYSSLVCKILLDAYKEGKQFKVVVVDAQPLLEGKEMLRKLITAGINCTYILISAVSFVMNSVTKVILGAHALLANGYVMSRIGTAQVALTAHTHNKPLLVCCETYKFFERVQTDSYVYNELGNPEELISNHNGTKSPLADWKTSNYLVPLNLMYDITPPDLVTAVVTEIAILPCTSVPVVLRVRPTEIV